MEEQVEPDPQTELILFVDDEPLQLRFGKRSLSRWGFEVHTAPDGRSGLEFLRRCQGRCSLVISDLRMPRMDGLEFLRAVKADRPRTDFILMTAYPELRVVVEALRGGAYDFLLKPFGAHMLRACVSRCVEKRRLAGALDSEKTLRAELQSAYRELQRAEYAKEAFLARLCHELRTPLAVVRGHVERLEASSRGTLGPAVQRLEAAIEELLTFSTFKKGEFRLSLRPFGLQKLVEECRAFCRPVLESKQVACRIEGFSGIPAVEADPDQLATAFRHLILNAAHFNRVGGSLTITGTRRGNMVQVAFMDTGIGIPPEAQTDIFSGFYQVAQVLTREVGGLGLGLAIVKRVIEAHGGKISVASRPDAGTVFYVYLPLKKTVPAGGG